MGYGLECYGVHSNFCYNKNKEGLMNHFEFEYPSAFLLLLLIICIYKCPLSIKKFIFPHLQLFQKSTSWIHKEKLIYSTILTLLIIALASPITYDQTSSNKRKGRDLVFVLDSSGSMAETNFDKEQSSKRKFDVIRLLLEEFISQRFDDNVGVAIFGTYAFAAVPLTYDMNGIKFLLNFFDVGIAGDSTAIGEGLAAGVRILNHGEAKSKVIILITDGFQNSGSISIKSAVEQAKKEHIKIYTIGIGKTTQFDATLLKTIAAQTNAKMFSAQESQTLSDIYNEIDSLEPSKIRSKHYLNKELFYTYPLFLALLLLSYLLLSSYKRENL